MNPRMLENLMVQQSYTPYEIYKAVWELENKDTGRNPIRMQVYPFDVPKLYVPIAASCTGKTTICREYLKYDDVVILDFDKLMIDAYSEDGKNDWASCCMMSSSDPKWIELHDSYIDNAFKTGKDILYDNVAVTREDREYIIAQARKYNYITIAFTMPIHISTLTSRYMNREYKTVSKNVCLTQYTELQQPSDDEFDYIIPLNVYKEIKNDKEDLLGN